MEIRIAKITDNLKEIAELIYETDPYIYPSISANKNESISVLIEMIKENTIYNYKNCLVAIDGDNILGLIVLSTLSSSNQNNYELWENRNNGLNYFVNRYIKLCEKQLSANEIYLTCVCTNKLYRRKKVATKLLQHVLNSSETIFRLDVLQNNTPAINLYKSLGFEIEKETTGFNKKYYKKPLIYSMVKK